MEQVKKAMETMAANLAKITSSLHIEDDNEIRECYFGPDEKYLIQLIGMHYVRCGLRYVFSQVTFNGSYNIPSISFDGDYEHFEEVIDATNRVDEIIKNLK